MTSSSLVDKTSALPGNGSNFTFSFDPLIVYDNTDIEVFHVVTSTGVETQITEGAGSNNYVFNGPTTFPGTGTITYPADSVTAIPSTETITIKKVLPLTQDTDFKNQGSYFPEVLERRFDKIVGMVIALSETVDRCLKIPVTDRLITNTEINPGDTRDATETVQINSASTGFITGTPVASTTGSASSATPEPVSVSAGAAGGNAGYSRDDHVHFLPTTVPRLATENIWTETQIWAKGGDVTAANALDLDAQAGNVWDVTGNTAITSIGTIGVGCIAILQFDGTPTLTHNATDLILPGGQDILMQAGDIVGLYEYASADWRLLFHTHGTATNGRMPGPDFESSELSLQADTHFETSHGLSRVPSKVELVLRSNTATAQGWSNNEEMIFPSCWQGAVADDGVDVTFNGANVIISQGANIQLLDHTSLNHETITQSEYNWVIRAWA